MNHLNRLSQSLAVTIGLAHAGIACAQANPYYVGASQAFTRESNVFRVPIGQVETDDTYSTTSLLAGVDQKIGRQRLFGDAALRHSRYQDNTQLNHTGYSADVGVDWETVQALSGRVGYTVKENQARYGADQGPVLTTKNLERIQEFVARGQYGMVGLLSLQAGYVHRQLDYSAPEFAFREFSQDSGRIGLLYRPGGLLTLGVGVRHTKGEYPFAIATGPGTAVSDDFTRNDIDFTAVYAATGQSTLNARLSYTKEKHDAVVGRNLSESTGALSWDYKPTGKLAFTTEYIRDTGAETTFSQFDPNSVNGVGNNSVLSNTVALRGTYEVTAKVQLQAGGRYVERELTNNAQTPGLPATGKDRYGEAKVGLTWMPTRSLSFGCAGGREKRGSNTALSYAYAVNIVSCVGQIKLQ
jgi:hypothetical protein